MNRHTINSATINGIITPISPFEPTLVASDAQAMGKWRVQDIRHSSTKATLGLIEQRTGVKVEIPSATFDLDTYPNAAPDSTLGLPIPIAFGKVKGIQAFLVDSSVNRFKFLNHPVTNVTRFYNASGEGFTPDVIDIGDPLNLQPEDATFIFTAWNGDDSLFVDCDAGFANPVDLIKLLLTDDVRGAGLDLSEIDTASTDGTGFGTSGARLKYISGTDSRTGAESYTFEMALYVPDLTVVTDLIDLVKATAFAFVYADLEGLWQMKAWQPAVTQGTLEVNETNIQGEISPEVRTSDPATKAIVTYDVNFSNDSTKQVTVESDELRQLRRLPKHSVFEATIPVSNKSGAERFAQLQVLMRGKPRRAFTIKATSQFKLTEIGDTLRLNYPLLGLSQVVNVIEVTHVPGAIEVPIKAMDVFGFRDTPGFCTEDPPSFPSTLGGATITDWDHTWSDEQVTFVRENLGFCTDENSYVDVDNDSLRSYQASVCS